MSTEFIYPEKMTRDQYRSYWRGVCLAYRILHPQPDSISWTSDIDARHLAYIRAAVDERRSIHEENRSEYRVLIPALGWYTINGNQAHFDTTQKEVFPTIADLESNRRRNHAQAVAQMDACERRKKAQ